MIHLMFAPDFVHKSSHLLLPLLLLLQRIRPLMTTANDGLFSFVIWLAPRLKSVKKESILIAAAAAEHE